MSTQFNHDVHLGTAATIRSSAACCVNVRDFGAIGKALSTKGSLQARSKVLTVDTLDGWAVGAGIGIAGASVGLTPSNAAALVTRIVSIDPTNKALHLKDAAANAVVDVSVTSDDSLPIQDAIDSLGKNGGTVCLPPGTYMIGTTGATTNQPIVLVSNLRVIGAGKGATTLRLCQEANFLWQAERSTPSTGFRMAGPIFINAANFWWYGTQVSTAEELKPYYGLPHDSNIEIAGITFDGDKNHQTLVYESEYRPNSTRMPKPTTSVFLTGASDAAGQLPAGTYDVFIRFQDAGGDEGMGALTENDVNLGLPNNALAVSLPPIFPDGSVTVVPYIRRADLNEQDSNGNPRYERLDPILLSSIHPWDGNPNPSHWPTIRIRTHTLYPEGPALYPKGPLDTQADTQGNYRFPGIVNYWGNTGASYFAFFINAKTLYVHDIEVRNFVSDGFGLQNVNYSKFDRVHSHQNGRHGVSIVTSQMEEVDFNDCVLESNESWGVDMEDIGGKSLRFNRCSFLNNNNGVGIGVDAAADCQDLEFNTCLFDGNGTHLVNRGDGNVVNLKIKDCRFRNNDSSCIQIGGGASGSQNITGEITGCDFDQSNGRGGPAIVPYTGSYSEFAPGYDLYAQDVPAIILSGLQTAFRITNNHFKPWAAAQTGTDGVDRIFVSSQYMIDISGTAGGHTIQNNHFELNPLDPRPPVSPGPGVGWSRNIKNQGFIFAYLDTLGSNKISGNIGDGVIWTGTQATGATIPCGLDLEEEGSTPVAQGLQSIAISFVHALPAPLVGNYLVTAAFNWNAGAWWVADATQSGFTINWEPTQAPAASASLAPQITWSAKFVA
jgi:hypothetical protein